MSQTRVLIMGAAGRDFHNFNTVYRNNEKYDVACFTATQIPDIEGRRYPPQLAGARYPNGIPIHHERELVQLIHKEKINEVVFAYSDVAHEYVMHKASAVLAAGASFRLIGTAETMLKSTKPVVAICAVRTGSGKSQTTRRVSQVLKSLGKKLVVVRHPMPYGDLAKQAVQRFGNFEDLEAQHCTIEEREEYEPHLRMGTVVYAGIDYAAILERAQAEAEIVVWDGGNNDTPFFKPDLHIVVTDPLRPGHETHYHPGETNLRMADVVVINKEANARPEAIESVREAIRVNNPRADIVDAASPIFVEDPGVIRGKRVLCIEDGPTLTHGEMTIGAGVVAAQRFGAQAIVDPRPFLKGSLVDTFKMYPGIGTLLPAMGYGEKQTRDLEATINATDCDAVVIATPIDLRRLVKLNKPATRVTYELQEIGQPTLADFLKRFA
ncbi:MAG: cyclic 2,3-diphosphoglycerate synthase [bacterium]